MHSGRLMLSLSLLCACFAIALTDSRPIMVIDLFRHGARSSYDSTWDISKLWGGIHGELTKAGMRQHYLLGKALAQDYSDLLGTYDLSRLSIYSTDVNRTIMSAYSHLFGMFSPGAAPLTEYQNKTALPPGLENFNLTEFIIDTYPLPNAIQPTPVHVVARKRDYVLAADNGCTNFEQIKEDSLEHSAAFEEFKNIINATMKLIEQHAQQYNITIHDIWTYWGFGDTLICNYYENFPTPFNITYGSKEWKDAVFITEWILTYLYSGPLKNLQLMSLNLFNKMFDQLDGKLNGTFNKTFAIHSAHESTLVPVLAVLGVVTPECIRDNYLGKIDDPLCKYPAFAANVITELYNDTAEPYVKFKYNGIYLNICNNTNNTCTLTAYKNLVTQRLQGYTLQNWLTDCGISVDPTPSPQPQPTPQPDNSGSNTLLIIGVIALGIVTVVELGVLVMLLRRKHKNDSDYIQDNSVSVSWA